MILDVHTHIVPPEISQDRGRHFGTEPDFKLLYADPRSKLIGGSELVAELDRSGATGACAFGFPWNSMELAALNNQYVLDEAKRFPGRIFPFVCVNPLCGAPAVAEVEKRLAGGAMGIGEIATYNAGMGEAVREALAPIAELAAQADVPLLLHANEPVGHDYPGKSRMEVADLYKLIKNHPSTKWILAHWGGGLFFYNLLKKETAEVLANVWYDTAAGPYLYKPEVYAHFIEVAGADKLLYGSDYPLLSLERYRSDMEAAGVSKHDMKKILGSNLAGLLKICPDG